MKWVEWEDGKEFEVPVRVVVFKGNRFELQVIDKDTQVRVLLSVEDNAIYLSSATIEELGLHKDSFSA